MEIWNLETYVLQRAGNQEIQTLETSRRRSSRGGGGGSIYIILIILLIRIWIEGSGLVEGLGIWDQSHLFKDGA